MQTIPNEDPRSVPLMTIKLHKYGCLYRSCVFQMWLFSPCKGRLIVEISSGAKSAAVEGGKAVAGSVCLEPHSPLAMHWRWIKGG